MDGDGNPLLIDPTSIDPWEHLDYDRQTGNIVARFIPTRQNWDPSGMETVRLLKLAQREHLAEGYKRTYRRLSEVVQRFIQDSQMAPDSFIQSLPSHDDHRLAGWCFGRGANTEEPFSTLRAQRPDLWQRIRHKFGLE